MRRPLYLAVEGPIGVGKTTLVKKLAARLRGRPILEVVEDNPFLVLFYEDRDRYAFQTQLFFLMSRFQQQCQLRQPELFEPSIVADYHILKDRIFALLTLAREELSLYDRVYRSLETQILKPDVLIYLQAPVDELLRRIERRGRPFERGFDVGYLRAVSHAYTDFFATYRETPLLRVDNTHLDYAADSEHATQILDGILHHALALVGPAGPAGPAGDAGDAGDAGPAELRAAMGA